MKVVLYQENDLLGKLIKFFTRGTYVHCSIILPDNTVIDAKPFHGVVKHNCLNDTIKKDAIITLFDVQTTSDQDIIIIDFLNRQIGKKYDWWSVFGFILYTTEEGRKSYNKWFCSELIFATFNKVNISLLERAEAWKMSPTTLSYSSKLISI